MLNVLIGLAAELADGQRDAHRPVDLAELVHGAAEAARAVGCFCQDAARMAFVGARMGAGEQKAPSARERLIIWNVAPEALLRGQIAIEAWATDCRDGVLNSVSPLEQGPCQDVDHGNQGLWRRRSV